MLMLQRTMTVTVTLSLGRPHSSCMNARPEAHAGTKAPSVHITSIKCFMKQDEKVNVIVKRLK